MQTRTGSLTVFNSATVPKLNSQSHTAFHSLLENTLYVEMCVERAWAYIGCMYFKVLTRMVTQRTMLIIMIKSNKNGNNDARYRRFPSFYYISLQKFQNSHMLTTFIEIFNNNDDNNNNNNNNKENKNYNN